MGSSASGSETGVASHLHYEIEIFTDGKFIDMDPQLDVDDNAKTNNNINNLVDPQKWVTGEIKVGTRDEPAKIRELDEFVLIGIRPKIQIPQNDSFKKKLPTLSAPETELPTSPQSEDMPRQEECTPETENERPSF